MQNYDIISYEKLFWKKITENSFITNTDAITNSYWYSAKVKPLNLLVYKIAVCNEHGYNEYTTIAK